MPDKPLTNTRRAASQMGVLPISKAANNVTGFDAGLGDAVKARLPVRRFLVAERDSRMYYYRSEKNDTTRPHIAPAAAPPMPALTEAAAAAPPMSAFREAAPAAPLMPALREAAPPMPTPRATATAPPDPSGAHSRSASPKPGSQHST